MRIVFAAVGDPVGAGVVQSLARPGGNATGPSLQQTDTVGKRLGLFRELTPGLRRLAIMANSANASAELEMRDAQTTARALGFEPLTSESSSPRGFRARIRRAQRARGRALLTAFSDRRAVS